MKLLANEKTLPRIHLLGTLVIVLLLTLVLAALFSWQIHRVHRQALRHLEQVASAQIHARLSSEMDRAFDAIDFTRERAELPPRRSPVAARRLSEAQYQPRGEDFAPYCGYVPVGRSWQVEDPLSYGRLFKPHDGLIDTGDRLSFWENQQRREALERLRSARFGRTGYIGVSSLAGRILMMPATPQFEGRYFGDLPALEAAALERATQVARAGGGFMSYDWPDPASGRIERKTALVRGFQPWGWVLTVTMLDEELSAAVSRELEQQQLFGREHVSGLVLGLLAAALLGLGASLAFSRWSNGLFRDYHRRNLEQQDVLRESEDRLNTILDSVEAAIFIKGRDGRYRYANRQVGKCMGRPLSDIVGHEDAELHPPEWARQQRLGDARVFETGERVASEVVVECDGRTTTYAMVKLPLHDASGRIYALCGVSTDISDRKQVESVLAAARDAAEAADRAKADFMAKVSHELRTPMNVIVGMLHLAQQTPLTPQQQGYLQQLRAASRQLLVIITDMLDFSSLERGRLVLESGGFVLAEVLEPLAARVADGAAAKGLGFALKVDADVPAHLIGDPLRLSQMLQHYTDNALKFTERGSVVVRVLQQQRHAREATLRFEVSDTGVGVGVGPGQCERLFEGFEQADASATRRHGGAGLGLALVRQLAGLMGGTASCESQPGQGSLFWFSARFGLPAESPDHAAAATPYRWLPDSPGVEALGAPPAPGSGPAEAVAPDDPRWLALRERLLRLLRDDDVDSVQLFESQQSLLHAVLGTRYASLAQAMRNYDFTAALQLLEPAA